MPIILENLTAEQFEQLRSTVAAAEDMEQRLEALAPLTEYKYVEELTDEEGWKTKLAAVEQERDDYKQKYIDRFFSGTGIADPDLEPAPTTDPEPSDELNPMTYEDLYKED